MYRCGSWVGSWGWFPCGVLGLGPGVDPGLSPGLGHGLGPRVGSGVDTGLGPCLGPGLALLMVNLFGLARTAHEEGQLFYLLLIYPVICVFVTTEFYIKNRCNYITLDNLTSLE